jgi:hypothetical protein
MCLDMDLRTNTKRSRVQKKIGLCVQIMLTILGSIVGMMEGPI